MTETISFDSALWISAASIMGLLVLSAFFSGSETALTAASRGKLRAQADRGSKGAERALRMTEDSERLANRFQVLHTISLYSPFRIAHG